MSTLGDFVYLDYNATTPVDKDVADIIDSTLRSCWANPSSSHGPGRRARAVIDTARQQVAQMLGADDKEIVFTSGGTESNNLVLESSLQYYYQHVSKAAGDETTKPLLPHIVTSNVEHDSIKLYLERLVAEQRAEVSFVPVSHTSCRVEADDVLRAIRPSTCLITIMLANNETGVLQPVAEIVRKVRAIEQQQQPRHQEGSGGCSWLLPKILLHTDAAQAIGKIPVTTADLQVDYLTIVGHKFYGPRIGALYVRGGCADGGTPIDCVPPLRAMLVGGGQERSLRPGTENTPMIAGLGKAAELVHRNVVRYQQQQADVRDYLEARLGEAFGDTVRVNGRMHSSSRLPNTSNVSLIGSGLEGHRVLARCAATFIASLGAACHSATTATVAVADGKPAAAQHYSGSPILLACGIPPEVAVNAIRLSVGRETTRDDIDTVVECLREASGRLRPAGEANS